MDHLAIDGIERVLHRLIQFEMEPLDRLEDDRLVPGASCLLGDATAVPQLHQDFRSDGMCVGIQLGLRNRIFD
jgi:hypothetical protein